MASSSPSPQHHAADSNYNLTTSPPSTRNNAALGLIGGTFVGIMALTTPFVFTQLRSSLPYMATPRGKVEKALKFLARRSASSAKNNRTGSSSAMTQQLPMKKVNGNKLNFVDLGSGDGTAILAAASDGWNATGLELNPTLWFISSLRRLFSRSNVRSNSQFVMGDMFKNAIAKERLRDANCVMIFGVRLMMPQIANLVRGECRTGCFLMSYRFRVPLLADLKMIANNNVNYDDEKDDGGGGNNNVSSLDGGIDASLIYDEEEMRIYELLDENKTE